MIIVTGAAGFIGSCMVQKLNQLGYKKDVVVVDDFYKDYKDPNLNNKFIRDWVHRDLFQDWFKKVHRSIDFVFHFGARTDTVSNDKEVFNELNIEFSKDLWNTCVAYDIPIIYASSAATYGDGSLGFNDDHKIIPKLKPLNVYAQSKQHFDSWVLKQKTKPSRWVGLKFFNVYGPNEYFKGRMASVVYHFTHQAQKNGKIQLFRSHRDDYKDGHQSRDFIYVKDVVEVCQKIMHNQEFKSGIYNLGTGISRTYQDLAKSVWKTLKRKGKIEFIETPKDIRDSYQYYSKADMSKLRAQMELREFFDLEDGIEDYLSNYLMRSIHF